MIKLPDTLQEIFDIISIHLLTQRKASIGLNDENLPSCMYRTSDGLKCAAGALIPDNQYQAIFESLGWCGLVRRSFVQEKFAIEIGELQRIHDRAINKEDPASFWKDQLRSFAENRNLQCNFPEIQNA